MENKTKIIIGVVGAGVVIGLYFLLKKKSAPAVTGTTISTYVVENKNWDNKDGYAHKYPNGIADYFDKNGVWQFSSNESDGYIVINGVSYSPESNDLPRFS